MNYLSKPVPLAICALVLAGSAMAQTNQASEPQASTGKAKSEQVERAVSDTWITTKVKSEILANSVSKAFKVGVTTKQGVVILRGELPTQDSIDLVKTIAEKVKGVKSVDTAGLTAKA